MNVMDCVSTKDNMEYYENRLKTFDTYPKQMLPDKIQLARAGLYYSGKSDMCQCFRCHVKLSSWERDDDAIKEYYNGHLNANTSKWWEHLRRSHQDIRLDQVRPLSEGLERGLVIW